jgi:antitoxin CptB
MSDAGTDFDDPRSERPNVPRKRLGFRSWHRGKQEGDLVFGSFADTSLTGFDRIQLGRAKALLDCADPDLVDWIIAATRRRHNTTTT